jgi:hypothetical protein
MTDSAKLQVNKHPDADGLYVEVNLSPGNL